MSALLETALGLALALSTAEPAADAAVDDRLHLIAGRVAAIRGLDFRRDVSWSKVEAGGIRDHVVRRVERFTTPEEIAAEERVYRLLGLLPADEPLLGAFAAAVQGAAAGYYDPAEERFYLVGDLSPGTGEVLAAHELTHALEDQHHDLDARIEAAQHDADRSFAVSAVHEGSASLMLAAYTARGLREGWLRREELESAAGAAADGAAALEETPAVLRRSLLGAYVLGAAFLARGDIAVVRGTTYPVDSVDACFRAGPTSSEQILHPEKFWDPRRRDDPKPVAIPDLAGRFGAGWRRAAEGRFGELFLGLLTGAPTPTAWTDATLRAEAWTHEAVAGWGGDAWELWESGERAALVVVVEWDSARDARQFARAIDRPVRRRGARTAFVAGDTGTLQVSELLAAALSAGG